MMEQKIENLIRGSVKKTRARELRWSPTGVEDQYVQSFTAGIVIVDRYGGGEGFGLKVLNNQGNVVVELMVQSDLDPDYGLLKELFEAAVESHLRVEETIDGILRDLGT